VHKAYLAVALINLGQMDEASGLIAGYLTNSPNDPGGLFASVQAMFSAKQGNKADARRHIEKALEYPKNSGHFHHTAYNVASAYALLGEAERAVYHLQDCAVDGFPCFPLFERDVNLKSLRTNQVFIAFLDKQSKLHQRLRQTFRWAPAGL
jgi:tetratricopeptide (TPR) repeat protein